MNTNKLSLMLLIMLFGTMCAQATQYVRKNASTAAAQEDVEALNVALKKMRTLGCNEPFSWYSQGATHSIPDEIPKNPLCPSYTNKSDLNWSWDTCTHVEGSEIHFLIWHRLYIAHFERIVRKLSGKADFALPYWNYIDSQNRIMPTVFRTNGTALFETARLSMLNEGERIQSTMNDNLNINNLMKNRVFSVFNSNIDAAPHGAMHSYIGGSYNGIKMWNPIYQNGTNSGLMSQVPSAGFDPIFWAHHSNIDFLWQAWELSPNGKRPSLKELEAAPWPYKFYDENGKKVTYTIKEAYKAAFNIDYQYDQLKTKINLISTKEHKELVKDNAQQKKSLVWKHDIGQATKNNKLVIEIPAIPNDKKMDLLLHDKPEALVIEVEVSFEDQPNDAYSVYVVDGKGNRSLTGVMTFFGASHHMMKGHDSAHTGGTKKFVYDVTSQLPVDGDYHIEVESQTNKGETLSVKNIALYRY